jgi:hypothetical protein
VAHDVLGRRECWGLHGFPISDAGASLRFGAPGLLREHGFICVICEFLGTGPMGGV